MTQPEVLCLPDILEAELVSIHLERDLPETDPEYLRFLESVDAPVRGTEPSYAELKKRHREALEADAPKAVAARVDRLMQILRHHERSALCLSGGGIRSATFALGVLQGLAHQRLLGCFDYLSTVSGGGYIGSWLSNWMAGTGNPRRRQTIGDIQQALADRPKAKLDGERPEVGFLRSYSSYLSPELGLLSADTWTLAATVFRNMFLNWLIFVPMLAVALLVPYFALAVTNTIERVPAVVLYLLLAAGLAAAGFGVWNIKTNLPSVCGENGCSQKKYIFKVLVPLVLSAILMNTGWIGFARQGHPFNGWQFALFGAALHLLGWMGISKSAATPQATRLNGAATLVFAIVTGAAGGWLAYLLTGFLDPLGEPQRATWLTLPITLGIYFLSTALFIGLASKRTNDDDREWWARSGAWIMMVIAGWVFLGGVAIYAPDLLSRFTDLQKSLVGAGGLAAGWLGSLGGKSAKTDSGRANGRTTEKEAKPEGKSSIPALLMEHAAQLAPIVFLVVLLVGVAAAADWIVTSHIDPFLMPWLGIPEAYARLIAAALLICGLVIVASVMSGYVNINTFSLHAMYRSRLIRAYLGASHPGRKPNPFTGFDPADNLPMHELSPARPFHVVNIALNLVHGDRLAWQHRKAETFTVSRLHAGSVRVGYQPSVRYGDRKGISLGTAMAISGAAASPNMGYHSSPLLTFLMTFFNARLGWWLPNPGPSGKGLWEQRGPDSALESMVAEAFGLTDDRSPYVYLSDGGHFENLGLYEMIVRRCRTIVVVDASADPKYEFEDLANAIRKIRVDLGVAVRINKPIKMAPSDAKANLHCAVGSIGYSCIDGAGPDGTFIYIKPVIGDWHAIDIDHYRSSNPDFPQQSTADQFFDEAQFESYRRLGMETVEWICHLTPHRPVTLEEFVAFAAARAGDTPEAFSATC